VHLLDPIGFMESIYLILFAALHEGTSGMRVTSRSRGLDSLLVQSATASALAHELLPRGFELGL
jgi:hypothetical protein